MLKANDKNPAELVERARRGEEAAQQAVLAQLYPLVHKHLGFMLGFERVCEDALQESMLQIFQALPKFRGEASIKTWALRIATRTARRYVGHERALREREMLALEGSDPETAASDWVELASLLQILAPKKREAMVLMGILGCTASEAAAIMKTFPNTAASRFRHARAELEAHLSAEQPATNLARLHEDEVIS